MKHIKLFESFASSPAQLLVTGDWTGITDDGRPVDWVAPSTFFFEYLPSGSPIPSGYVNAEDFTITDLEYLAEEAFGGDQNGINVAPKDYLSLVGDTSQYAEDLRNGVLRIFIDPSISVSQLESYLREEASNIWDSVSDQNYYGVLDYGETEGLDPEYVRLAEENKPFPRKIIFKK